MPRVIRFFDKKTEEFKGEIFLPNIEVEILKHIMKFDSDDPLGYYCYPVNEIQANFFAQKGVLFDFLRFDYVLEYDR